jgi:hypothetical protein
MDNDAHLIASCKELLRPLSTPLVNAFALKMEVECFFETPLHIRRTEDFRCLRYQAVESAGVANVSEESIASILTVDE